MSDTQITQSQQYCLDRIRAAADFDCGVANYARSAGLTSKPLYSCKGILYRTSGKSAARDVDFP